MDKIIQHLSDILYVFTNYFVCNIPFWPVRKLIYQIRGLKIGKGSRILMKVVIVSPKGIRIGDNTIINEHCFIDGRGGVSIGSNVTIAVYSKLITGSHNIDDGQFSYTNDSIVIEDNVAVFADSVVLGGAHLRRGCVISAKSLVRKGEYEEFSIYGGNLAGYIRKRKSDNIYQQDKYHPLFR